MEVEKNKRMLLAIIVIILILTTVSIFFLIKNQENRIFLSDAMKFKEEYSALNDQESKTAMVYPKVNLNDTNPFVYKSDEQIVEILKNGTGILYFGFPSCPWCRTLVPYLSELANENNITEIDYLNIYEIRDTLDVDENNQIITKKEGTKKYYEILSLLDPYLEEYTIKNLEGEEIPTGRKRLLAPTLIAVKDGVIESFHVGTISSQTSGYSSLTKAQEKELKKVIQEVLLSIKEK